MPTANPLALFRPFLWVAVLAFLTGFSGVLLLGAGGVAKAYGVAHASAVTLEARAGAAG